MYMCAFIMHTLNSLMHGDVRANSGLLATLTLFKHVCCPLGQQIELDLCKFVVNPLFYDRPRVQA